MNLLKRRPALRSIGLMFGVAATVMAGYIVVNTQAATPVGDLNNDNVVNVFDLSLLLTNWGKTGVPADLNGNGTVDIFDLSTLLTHWGQTGSSPTPTPTQTPTPTPTPTPAGSVWHPTAAAPISWFWQLTGTVNTTHNVQVYDIDGWDATAATVSTLHAKGIKAICYMDLGTFEDWRPDAGSFPSSVKGGGNGWPGENWLDIRQINLLSPIMTARMQMCKTKGFDALEPDNIDGYSNSTGFPLTAADQITFNKWIASTAHSLGLSVGLKNDVDQTTQLQPFFDWMLDEECNQYSECGTLAPFTAANKAVFDAEYKSFSCAADVAARINGAQFDLDLTGAYTPCTGTW